ncbi:MAG: helix-turn-helix domain-containing protein [Geothrix sp.]|nr:helix-turn-helix domain-containing protein [Geothrix sp.]
MIPLALLPGCAQWGAHLDELLARPEALWICGPTGSGVSTLAEDLAARRGVPWTDAVDAEAAGAWLAAHPRGVVATRTAAPGSLDCLVLRLPGLDEEPARIPAILAAMAVEEGIAAALPPALAALPCPGNLRELRNRLWRWKLLGQMPASEPAGSPRFDAEDLASNLHQLEKFLLHQALRRAYGNRVEAARRLGVSRRQLYLLIRRHGDPVRGEPAAGDLPQRVKKRLPAQNSSPDPGIR